MASIAKRTDAKGTTWRARYRDDAGKLYERRFRTRKAAKEWAAEREAEVAKGAHVDPKRGQTPLAEWCDEWLTGYGGRESTRRQARTHLALVKNSKLGTMPLAKLEPRHVERWLRDLEDGGRSASYVNAVLGRLRQVLRGAIRNSMIHRNVAEEVSVRVPKRPIVLATADQIWALHDAMPEHLRATVLLGAFSGLRAGEICGLRPGDIESEAVYPQVQYPATPLKSETSRARVIVPDVMARRLALHVENHSTEAHVFVNEWGDQLHPRVLERAFRTAREKVRADETEAGVREHARLPERFRFHDCRHFYASYLIRAGLDVKVVQARMRHASATLTLDTYADLWPGSDDGTRDAVGAAFAGREESHLRVV